MAVDFRRVTNSPGFEGSSILSYHGVARGISVRSRGLLGTVSAVAQAFAGGRGTLFADLCDQARQEAMDSMLAHAAQLGGNAIVSMRYDTNDLADGITEVMAYGTAVVLDGAEDE